MWSKRTRKAINARVGSPSACTWSQRLLENEVRLKCCQDWSGTACMRWDGEGGGGGGGRGGGGRETGAG